MYKKVFRILEMRIKIKTTHLMRRIMRLYVMCEVINMMEVGMAVVDAIQKFPVFCLFVLDPMTTNCTL